MQLRSLGTSGKLPGSLLSLYTSVAIMLGVLVSTNRSRRTSQACEGPLVLQSFIVAMLTGILCNKAAPFAMHCPVLEGPDLL